MIPARDIAGLYVHPKLKSFFFVDEERDGYVHGRHWRDGDIWRPWSLQSPYFWHHYEFAPQDLTP